MTARVEKFADIGAQLDAESEKIEALHASIEAQVEAHRQKIFQLRDNQAQLALDAIEESGASALHDVDTARMVYTADWMNGVGNQLTYEALRDLFADVPYMSMSGTVLVTPDQDYSGAVVSQVNLSVPRKVSAAYVALTVEAVEPVMRAQLAIAAAEGVESVRMDVEEHTLSEHGVFYAEATAEGYQLFKLTYGHSEELTGVLSLNALLFKISELCPSDSGDSSYNDDDRWVNNW